MEQKYETCRTPDLYINYLKYHQDRVEVIQNEVEVKELLIDNLIKKLKRYEGIVIFDNYTVDMFLKKSISKYINDHQDFYSSSNEKLFLKDLKLLRELKVGRKRGIDDIKKLNKLEVSKEEFKFIVDGTNKIMVEEMIEHGEHYCISGDLGYFAISRKRNKEGARILNKGASQKLKEQYIKDGIEVKSEDNPDGKSYNVYFLDDYFYRMKWFRESKFLYNENILNYRFYHSKGNHHVIKKLYDFIRANPSNILMYKD